MANSTKKPRKESPQASVQEGRRRLFKTIALGGGAVGLAKWSKPIVSSIILPAHAQATGGGGGGGPVAPTSCVTTNPTVSLLFQVGSGGPGASLIGLTVNGNFINTDTLDGASAFSINQPVSGQISGPGFDWTGTVTPGAVGVGSITGTVCGYGDRGNGTTDVRTASFVAVKSFGAGAYNGQYTAAGVIVTQTIGTTGDACLAVFGGPGGAACI